MKEECLEVSFNFIVLVSILVFDVFLQELVSGVVVIQSKGELPHQGLTLTMEGSVNLQLSAKSVGVFEAFYNSLKV